MEKLSSIFQHMSLIASDSVSWFLSLPFLGKILAAEFIIIAFTIGTVLFYNKFKLKKYKKSFALQNDIYKFISNAINKRVFISIESLKPEWKNLALIIPVIIKLNKKFETNTHWLFMLDHLLTELLLPMARVDAHSTHWIKRYWALRCMILDPRPCDEEYLIGFLLDPVAHNRFIALGPLLKIGNNYSVQAIIDSMKRENRHTRAVYVDLMKNSQKDFLEFVRERLLDEEDPEIRRVCIDIISDSVENSDLFLLKRDVRSPNKQLKLTAIRCLNKFDNFHATQMLLRYMKDKDWEVRSLTSKLLGERKAYQAIPLLLQNLCDKNWWVRFNAALALAKLDRPGLAALNSITAKQDRYAYQMAQYVKRLNLKSDEQKVALKMNFENVRKSDAQKTKDMKEAFKQMQEQQNLENKKKKAG